MLVDTQGLLMHAIAHYPIPTHSGQEFRLDAGHRSELMPATVPN